MNNDQINYALDESQRQIAKLTDMLCSICMNENYGDVEMRLPDDILDWWKNYNKTKDGVI